MNLKIKIIKKSLNIKEIAVFDEHNPSDKRIAYKINKRKKEILFYPKARSFFLDFITIKGFDYLPKEFIPKGYIASGTLYYLNKKLKDRKIIKLTISKLGKTQFVKTKGKYRVILNYKSFQNLKSRLASLNYESSLDKSASVDDFFHNMFPKHFKKEDKAPKKVKNTLIRNLNESVIEHLEGKDVDLLLDFFEKVIKKKYKSKIHKHNLFSQAKIKIDEIAISSVIKEFEEKLKKVTSESKWGNYLRKNLFLIDSKYVHKIPELNVVLAGSRKVDFGLIDSQGHLDIFEIKKPETQLLAKIQDRGNYYWSTEAIKAIVQAEKYLYHAHKKAADLEKDIKREKKLDVKVIKPRAVVIMGNYNQLTNEAMQEDFRILRSSLKNVEIILYDELLNRIKLQKDKIYID